MHPDLPSVLEQIQRRGVFELREGIDLWPSLSLAIRIDEQVRENAKEPCLEIRAVLKTIEGAKRMQRGLLDEILSVVAIARQVQRRSIGSCQERCQV
jgi:hypothetical protein